MKKTDWSLIQDLESIYARTLDIWLGLAGAHLFISGGTGFIGCWLLESLIYSATRLQLDIHATVLTRNVNAFRVKSPHLANSSYVTLIEGDVCGFAFPAGKFTHAIHAATDASADLNEKNPLQMYKTVVDGTSRLLEFAAEKNIPKTLFLSSGAVYGQQPWEMTNVSESYLGGPNCVDPRATYAEGKRAAEMLCAIFDKQFGMHVVIARIFALLGPYLPLSIHFAAGNFIQDVIDGREIVIKGNGKPVRSYLYASDLTVFLWHLLLKGKSCKPYNVGSSEGVSISDLAKTISTTLGGKTPKILGAEDIGWNPGRYVPSTVLIEDELNLKRTVDLKNSILRTAIWNGWKEK